MPKSSGVAFQQVLQQYAMERFLYRVSKSKYATMVILKGALLLKTVGIPRARPTLDTWLLTSAVAYPSAFGHRMLRASKQPNLRN